MLLDFFYGFRDTHKIDSFAKLFRNVGMEESLKGSNALEADLSIYRLISDILSDGHFSWNGFSYLTGKTDYKATDATVNKLFKMKSYGQL